MGGKGGGSIEQQSHALTAAAAGIAAHATCSSRYSSWAVLVIGSPAAVADSPAGCIVTNARQ